MAPLPAQQESSMEPELMKLYQQIQTQKDAQPCRAEARGAFRFAELFAGIGGFRLALERLGGECVFASELHPTARAIYLENWPSTQLEGDIRLVPAEEVPDHELLVGGFPCQPFSTLGEQGGLADQRGRLFLQICRILRSRKPLAALLENVPGILNCDDGRVMAEVLQGLEDSGYRVAHRVIDSSSILPQKRRRVYFVAIRMDLPACERFRFPWLPQLKRALEEVLEPITEEQKGYLTVSEKYWSKLVTSQVYLEKPSDIVAVLEEPAAPLISGYGSTRSAGPFAAVTQFVPQGEERPRMLSQRECARLQGFPESYRLEHCDDKRMAWYRVIGNAVSVPVISAVAQALLDALELLPRAVPSMAGTRASLLCLLDACPADRKSALLRKEIQLLPSLCTANVAALLAALECPGEERGHVPPEIHPAKRWQRREVKAQATAPPTTQPASNPAGYPPAAAVSTVPAPPAPPAPPVPEAVTARHKPPDKCPICLEGFEAAGAMPRTCRKCQNNFHQACLSEWAKKEQQIKWEQKPWMLPSQFDSGTCPCCRSSKGHDKSRRWKK